MLGSVKPSAGRLPLTLVPTYPSTGSEADAGGDIVGPYRGIHGVWADEQMEDNLGTASEARPLSEEEKAALRKVVDLFHERPTIGCTACRYCVAGCPRHIVIPELFKAMNSYSVYGDRFRSTPASASST